MFSAFVDNVLALELPARLRFLGTCFFAQTGDSSACYELGATLQDALRERKCILGGAPRAEALLLQSVHAGRRVEGMVRLGDLFNNQASDRPQNAARAAYWYEYAIQVAQDVGAMNRLASLLRTGAGDVRRDCPRAADLFARAASKGDVLAMRALANMLLSDEDVEEDAVRAVHLLQQAADAGSVEAMNDLAEVLKYGDYDDVPCDRKRAAELYERVATETGDVEAMGNLANLVQRGFNGSQTFESRAVHLLICAADEGESMAFRPLTWLLTVNDCAIGVQNDVVRAAEILQRAVDAGETSAMCLLASLLDERKDCFCSDLSRALRLYERAMEDTEDVTAMLSVSALLLHSQKELVETGAYSEAEIQQFPARGVKALERAVDLGDLEAIEGLAWVFEEGTGGVEVNCRRAAELHSRAASLGHADSMSALAALLYHGTGGVEKDRVRAAELYQQAVDTGDFKAAVWLAQLLEEDIEGLPRDLDRATEVFDLAIQLAKDTSYLSEVHRFATFLLDGGEGLLPNTKRAFKLYEVAVNRGFVKTNRRLAMLLTDDENEIPEDVVRAVQLLEEAIDEINDSEAMLHLGELYETGRDGLERNVLEAVKLYRQACKAGNPDAPFCLESCLDGEGYGVAENIVKVSALCSAG